jgi:UDP-sulfoquinovose synthase
MVVEALGRGDIEYLDNPRTELQEHHYNAAHTKLSDLGLVPHLLDAETIRGIASIVERQRDRIDLGVMTPTIDWRNAAVPGANPSSAVPATAALR